MSAEGIVDRYCEAWSLPEPSQRAAALAESWAPAGSYSDPMVSVTGTDTLLAHIARVRANYPQARVVRTSVVDVHGSHARFAWQMVLADGTRLPEGTDVVHLSEDHSRIESIIGFFGPLKARRRSDLP